MREGTFKIDRAIREIETWIPARTEIEEPAYQRVLDLLREIRDTDPEEANQ